MSVFKDDVETKRVIFNVRMDLAVRLEKAKEEARLMGKKLDVDSAVDKALEKFLRKAERKLEELREKSGGALTPLAEDAQDECREELEGADAGAEADGKPGKK